MSYVVTPASARSGRTADHGSRRQDLAWCEVADEVVWWQNTDNPLPQELRRLAGAQTSPTERDLYLVGQAGESFMAAFPQARVALDKGRYLVVALTPDELDEVTARAGSCFGIVPLPENTVVVTGARRPGQRRMLPAMSPVTDLVSQEHLLHTLMTLSSFHTRHSLSSDFSAAADWARAQLESFGFAVSMPPISVGTETSFNLVADRMGTAVQRRLIVATAHLDSVNLAGGQSASAPGADDNGSGAAGVIEIGRIFGSLPAAEHDLRLILFGGEEQGLHGSFQHVAELGEADRSRLDAVINMDMIGTLNVPELTVLLEGAPVSQQLMDDLSAAAGDYTSLLVQTSLHPFASDHVPFINAGLPALLTIEGADTANTNVHTADDLLTTIHAPLAVEILKMNVAVLAQRLGTAEVPTAPHR